MAQLGLSHARKPAFSEHRSQQVLSGAKRVFESEAPAWRAALLEG